MNLLVTKDYNVTSDFQLLSQILQNGAVNVVCVIHVFLFMVPGWFTNMDY